MKFLSNRVTLIGHVGKDPELTTVESGKMVANFSLGTSSSYKNSEGETIEDTQWHQIVAWGNTADIAGNYLKKGSKVAVEGKLTYRKYLSKEGVEKQVTEVVINEIMMLDR